MDDLKKPRVVMAAVGGLLLSWSGCGDMLMPPPFGPDAGTPMVDANFSVEPDAIPIDGPPPWEPPDPIFPDDPCEIVSDLPELEYDSGMANYAIRFNDGMGLEDSPDIRQSGLLEVENGHVDNRNVIEKRFGADVLEDTLTTGGVIPDADKQAIWNREDELVLQTYDSIYSANEARADAEWRRVASWTKGTLRESYANAFGVTVDGASMARLGDIAIVAYELFASSVSTAVFGAAGSLEISQSIPTSERPRLTLEGDRVRLTYRDTAANSLFTDTFLTGDSSFTPSNSTVGALAGRAWDVHSAETQPNGDRLVAFASNGPAADNFFLRTAVQGTLHALYNRAVAGATIADVAVAVWPRRVAKIVGNSFRFAAVWNTTVAGVQRIEAHFLDFDVSTAALDFDIFVSTPLADATSPVRSVAVSWADRETMWIAVEQEVAGPPAYPKVTYYSLARGGALSAPVTVHESTSLVSQGAIIAGTPSDTLISGGAPPLVPAFVEQLVGVNSINRSGWVLYAPRTAEVVARSFVGYTGNYATRINQYAKGSLISGDGIITWAGPASILAEPGSTNLFATATCTVDMTPKPAVPAVVDHVAVDALAGYPRAYDGARAFEHDWHSIPHIANVATGAAGPPNNFTAGTYTFAATWEWDDSHGMRYRSAPSTIQFSIGGNFQTVNVTIAEGLSHTEKNSPRLVLWRTLANGNVLRRARLDSVIAATTNGQTIVLSDSDASVAAREQLDQAPTTLGQGVVESRPARVTDFVGYGLDRLFSRDPLQGKIVRFTIPSREATGFAMHWPLGFALEEPDERDVTSVLEMDGRIVVGSELGLALLNGDGPDATGVGAFGLPTILRTEIGIEDQPQLTRTPLGYAFGTVRGGPRLLTPGLTVESLEKPVERQYKIDGGNVVAIAYDQFREEMVFLDNAQPTLRLNTSTMRWAHDSNRIGRDLTVRKDGTLYMIRSDGKVLKQRQDVWADGGVGYPLRVSTPWIRGMSKDLTSHPPFRLNGIYVSGEYVGPHDLFFDVYKDFNNVTPWATFTVPEATVVANAAANRGWVYGVRLGGQDSFYAARIVVRDGAEPNQTFRLGQMDIDVEAKNMTYVELPQSQYAARV